MRRDSVLEFYFLMRLGLLRGVTLSEGDYYKRGNSIRRWLLYYKFVIIPGITNFMDFVDCIQARSQEFNKYLSRYTCTYSRWESTLMICFLKPCTEFYDLNLHKQMIYNYLCNQCLSPLRLWGQIPLMARCTWYNIM